MSASIFLTLSTGKDDRIALDDSFDKPEGEFNAFLNGERSYKGNWVTVAGGASVARAHIVRAELRGANEGHARLEARG